MTTKLDRSFAKQTIENVSALVNEVDRLEGILEEIEKLLDPNPSPGGDTLWLVKHYITNQDNEIKRLKQKCGE